VNTVSEEQEPETTKQNGLEQQETTIGWNNYAFIGTNDPAAAADDDDKSVKASNLRPMKTKREMYLRLSISPKDSQAQDRAIDDLCTILKTIAETNDKSDLEIFDNHGVSRNALRWKNLLQFTQQFTVYNSKKPRKTTNWRPNYWLTFRVHTNTPIRTIRNHKKVSEMLKDKNARLAYTLWTDQPEDAFTSALGFLLGYSPKHCPTHQVLKEINAAISAESNTDITAIPTWKPTMTTTSINVDGTLHRNVSYDVTCRTADATKLRSLLEISFAKPKFRERPKFAPYQLKRSHPEIFSKLVDYQADFTNHMVIAVEGIPVEHMYCGFQQQIQDHFPAISAVYEHKNTRVESDEGPMIGRWNLMCPTSSFDTTASNLKNRIGTLYEDYMGKNNRLVLPYAYFPTVTSNIRSTEMSDDMSDITRNSFASYYESSSITSYNKTSPEDTHENMPPSIFGLSATAHPIAPATYAQAVQQTTDGYSKPPIGTPTTVSDITLPSSATQSIQAHMEHMQRQMESLQAQLAQMAAQLSLSTQFSPRILPPAPSSPTPYPPTVLQTKRPSPITTLPSKKRNDQKNSPSRMPSDHG